MFFFFNNNNDVKKSSRYEGAYCNALEGGNLKVRVAVICKKKWLKFRRGQTVYKCANCFTAMQSTIIMVTHRGIWYEVTQIIQRNLSKGQSGKTAKLWHSRSFFSTVLPSLSYLWWWWWRVEEAEGCRLCVCRYGKSYSSTGCCICTTVLLSIENK